MKRKHSTIQKKSSQPENQAARRHLLKAIASGGTIATAATLVPSSWVKPVINSVTLPAHAQTSTPTVYALEILSGPTIRSAGSTPPDLECRNGPELDPVVIGVTPADGSKDGMSVTMTRTWGTGLGAGKNSTPDVQTIAGNTVSFQPNGFIPGIDVCNNNFTDNGDTVTLGFSISDNSATPTSIAFTAEDLI